MNECVFCDRFVHRDLSLRSVFSFQTIKEPIICGKCFRKFEKIEAKKACMGCSRKQTNQELCKDCVRWRASYLNQTPKHTALYVYNDIAREYMDQFKFQGDIHLSKLFREILELRLKPYQKSHIIVPIPLSKQSQKERGFNQVEKLLKNAGISFRVLLTHVREEEKQSSKNRKERMESKQPFKLTSTEELKNGKPILIVDDVYTTGRTLYHAREAFEVYTKTDTFSLFR